VTGRSTVQRESSPHHVSSNPIAALHIVGGGVVPSHVAAGTDHGTTLVGTSAGTDLAGTSTSTDMAGTGTDMARTGTNITRTDAAADAPSSDAAHGRQFVELHRQVAGLAAGQVRGRLRQG